MTVLKKKNADGSIEVISGISPDSAALAQAVTDVEGLKTSVGKINPLVVDVVGNDIAAAVAAISTAGAGVLRVPRGAIVTVSTTTALPNAVREVIIDGDIICTADVSVFTRTGTVTSGSSTSITATIAAGARTVTAVPPASLAVGDWVLVVSADTLPGTSDKLGYMRQIKAFTGTTVTFDAPMPRALPDSTRRFARLDLASPIRISGNGSISYATPTTNFSSMLAFRYCRDVTVEGVRLFNGGGNCINLAHVAGFKIDCRIDNFLDDVGNNHVGYGVNVNGATRDGIVRGRMSRCRHAFTTNVGPADAVFNFYGEPENIRVEPITHNCTDKALDTHRAGWGITMVVNDKGSGGGIQIRADNVTVSAGVIDGSFVGSALAVGPDLVVPPNIGPLQLTNIQATNAVFLESDAYFSAEPRMTNVGTKYATSGNAKAYLPPKSSFKRKAADQTVTATPTVVSDTELALPLEAGTTYAVDAFLITSGPQAADYKLSWLVPTNATFDWSSNGLSTGSTSTGGNVVLQARTAADAVAVGTIAVGSKTVVPVKGILTTDATNPGSITLQWCQAVSDAGVTATHAGSTLSVTRIA